MVWALGAKKMPFLQRMMELGISNFSKFLAFLSESASPASLPTLVMPVTFFQLLKSQTAESCSTLGLSKTLLERAR